MFFAILKHMKWITFLITFFLMFTSVSTGLTTTYSQLDIATDKIEVSPGDSLIASLTLSHRDGWHSYWKNPGESGLATTINWTLPDGFTAGEIQWPFPEKIPFGDLINIGFKGKIPLLVPMTVSSSVNKGEYQLQGTLKWLVCEESCIPESLEFKIPITIAGISKLSPQALPIRKLQKEREIETIQTVYQDNESFILISLPAFDIAINDVEFFPEQLGILDYKYSPLFQFQEKQGVLQLKKATVSQDQGTVISGLLRINQTQYFQIQASKQSIGIGIKLMTILAFAFLGGLILNIMPCVFPILSLKVLAILDKGKQEQALIRKQALSYTLGVIISFFIIVTVLVWLKFIGLKLGWGFQLQNPLFIMMMILIMMAVGLNLNDRFSLPQWLESLPGSLSKIHYKATSKSGWSDFFTGVLAVVVATPCTAPFMATAIGFALTQPIIIMYITFLALALGFSFPFLLIAYIPQLQQLLPKPGGWMITVRHWLAIPLYLTVFWLIWVLTQQIGTLGWSLGFAMVGILLVSSFLKMFNSRLLMILALSSLLTIGFLVHNASRSSTIDTSINQEAFTAISVGLQSNQKMLIDVTASWCVSCKVNENVVLQRPDIKQFLAENKIAMIVLDWTNYDEDITRYLESFNRQGVPLYVYYNEEGKPTVLPQVLQKKDIYQLIKEK